MRHAGWDVTFSIKGRLVAGYNQNHFIYPQPPCFAPHDDAVFSRDGLQRYLVTADYCDNESAFPYGRAIVAVCTERELHTPAERKEFVNNIAHLCDIKIGALHD